MNEPSNIPQILEMEKFVLSAMLIREGEIIPTVMSILRTEHFYRPVHRVVFDTLIKLYQRRISPNILSLMDEIRKEGKLEEIGVEFLYSLTEYANTTAYVETLARTIKEKATLRSLARAGEEITKSAYEDREPFKDILDNAEKKIFEITSEDESSDFEHVRPIIMRSFDRIRRAIDNPKGFTGLISSTLTD